MFKKILEILINLLPDWLIKLYEKGLIKIFITIVFFVAFIPPLTVFVAAYWLDLLSKSDNDALLGLRKTYLETIYNGFSIEDVASRSNIRLDYFQLFEFDLTPSNAPSKDFMVSIMPSQKNLPFI